MRERWAGGESCIITGRGGLRIGTGEEGTVEEAVLHKIVAQCLQEMGRVKKRRQEHQSQDGGKMVWPLIQEEN